MGVGVGVRVCEGVYKHMAYPKVLHMVHVRTYTSPFSTNPLKQPTPSHTLVHSAICTMSQHFSLNQAPLGWLGTMSLMCTLHHCILAVKLHLWVDLVCGVAWCAV